jgi:hypothetical protein
MSITDMLALDADGRTRSLWVEAVRKLSEILQTTAQSKIFRDFFASEGSESSKKRTKQIRLKTRRSFHTASVDLTRSSPPATNRYLRVQLYAGSRRSQQHCLQRAERRHGAI